LYEAGRDNDAEREITRSVEILQPDQKTYTPIYAETKLALLNKQKGQNQRAISGLLRALNAARQTKDLTTVMYCADAAALLVARWMSENKAVAVSELEVITRILGAVDRWREILGYPRTPRDKYAYIDTAQFLRGQLGEQSFLRKWTEGQSISMERGIDEAIRPLRAHEHSKTGEQRTLAAEEITVRLSERENQVLRLVAEGLSNQEIGERLFITERTVRFHMTSIFQKLGADNRAQAVAIANRLGIL
jgi:ATP/maltotriose-dependent transcriptional regulator MalT